MHARHLSLILGLLAAVLLLIPATAAAKFRAGQLESELGPGVTVEKQSETGKLRFVGTAPGKPIDAPIDGSRRGIALAFAESLEGELGVGDAGDRLEVGSVERLDDGRASVRLQQVEQGVPVIGGEVVVNLDPDRDVLSLSGEASPRPDLETDPAVSAEEADDAAFATVAREYGISPDELTTTEPELSILDSRIMGGPGLDRPTLVWRMEITPADPASLEPIREFVAVDAELGNAALSFSQIAEAKERFICDAADATAKVPCTAPFARTEGESNSGDTDVDLAYDYSGDTYDFFFDRFGRDSLNGAGLQLKSTVAYCPSPAPADCPYANAFWNGSQMVYGEGYSSADDVVGHELTHGVTDFSSDLFYYYQSGAINESMSDVFGELVDLSNGVGSDAAADRWLLGEDLPSIGAIRSLKNPPAFNDPDRMQSPKYYFVPDTNLGGPGDAGGVHINSGVSNKAAFLIADGESFNGQDIVGIGLEKLAFLYYEVNDTLLTRASDYQDLASALRQACTNQVVAGNLDAADCDEVEKAVLATEMDQEPAKAPTPQAATCPSGDPVISQPFFDDLETSFDNWEQTKILSTGVQAWSPGSFYPASGDVHLYGQDPASVSDSAVVMTADVSVPGSAYLHFKHAYGFETGNAATIAYDGGMVEYSTDGGTSWADLGPMFEANGYSGSIVEDQGNPAAGRTAFVGESAGYISSRAYLGSLGGRDVRFRWRIATDGFVSDYGWFLDDVGIYECQDNREPETRIDSGPAEGETVSTLPQSFGFSSPDDSLATFECSLDGAAFGPCSGLRRQDLDGLTDGGHTFAVRAKDGAGNQDSTPATRSFTVDTTPPETRIDSGPADGSTITATTATFGFSSPDDPAATFSCSVDGGAFGPCTAVATHTLTGLGNGGHTFAVRASDAAGNTDATPATRSFTVRSPADDPVVTPPTTDPPVVTDDTACAKAKKKLRKAKKQLRKASKKARKAKMKAKRASGKKGKRLEKKAKKLKKKAKQKRKKKRRAQAAKKLAC